MKVGTMITMTVLMVALMTAEETMVIITALMMTGVTIMMVGTIMTMTVLMVEETTLMVKEKMDATIITMVALATMTIFMIIGDPLATDKEINGENLSGKICAMHL